MNTVRVAARDYKKAQKQAATNLEELWLENARRGLEGVGGATKAQRRSDISMATGGAR